MNRTLLVITLSVVVVGSALLGQQYGEQEGQKSKALIELVWPSFDSFTEADRAVLAGFSMTCNLQNRAKNAYEVISCLREASSDPNAVRPNGMDQSQASARLESMISNAESSL
ncbi:hypothetical protein ACFQDN_21915 [Pseudomonas asuensis]|uniref:Uncharacterized protein n=1 Tax=Pseudomonas asuensis TaxID=1825787 RepID=A0ABQ2H3G4_9PSED|nr:hypothetical protein [Pseudomonas asuensis]GGM25458.1 hypothetical protein GCM10009425_40270 [Pseudomonas asuensis]